MEIIQHKFLKFFTSKFRHSNHRIGLLIRSPARIIPYPTGRLFWMAPSQALRARLRSHRPSGTKAIRSSQGLAIKLALMGLKPLG
jgi:hypothetical protein